MSTARKILSNTIAQIMSKAVTALIGVAVVKISTTYLSRAGYGEYVFVYEFLAFFGIAADLGLFTIAVREMSYDDSKISKIIGNILSLRTLLVISTMLLAILAIFLIPKYENTRIPIGVAIATLSTFFTILNGTVSSVLQAKLKMHISSATAVLSKIISVSLMAYIAFIGYPDDQNMGFYLFLWAGVFANMVMFFTTAHYVKKITTLNYQFDFQLWKDLLYKSLPYGVALILSTMYFRIDSMMISYMRGNEELGLYGAAMKILEQLGIIPLYFMNAVLPVLSRNLKENNTENYKKVISYAFDFLAVISIPMVVGGYLLAYPIIFIISTPEFLSDLSRGFYGSDMAFKILIFASMFQFLGVLFAFILIALDKQKKLLYINAACVIFNIVTNAIFIPIYGFVGAAVTSVICEIFILAATFFTARHYLHFHLNLKNLAKIVASSLIMGLCIYLLQDPTYALIQNWNVFLLIIIGAVVYGILIILSGVIDRKMINTIRSKAPEQI